jgi:peptidoglycan/LPS O-acetylase OafA/YrhL
MNIEQNNFDFLRVVFASLVIVTHSYALIGLPEIDLMSAFSNGRSSLSFIGVRGFFTISGFLIFTSFSRTKSPLSFLWKRIVRIWPALLVLLLATALVIGAWVTTLPLSNYFSDINTYYYIYNNLLLLKGISYSLPGVFSNNLYPTAVNGSLWTLPYEVLFYLILSVFYVKKSFNLNYILIPFWLLFLVLRITNYQMSGSILSIAFDKMLLVELGMYFMAGMMLSKNFHLFSSLNIKWGVFLMCIALFIVFAKQPALSWLQFIIVPLATIMFAYLPIQLYTKQGVLATFHTVYIFMGFWCNSY